MSSSQKGSPLWLGVFSLVLAALALLIHFLTPYNNILKPFDLRIRIDPRVGLHYRAGVDRHNLGLYLSVDLKNQSPKSGLVTRACIVLHRDESPEDKYLLEFGGFRVLNEAKTVYIDSEEELPLLIEPRQRTEKTVTFWYNKEQEFPISTGAYSAELMLWIDDNEAASYVEKFEFEITHDILTEYDNRRKKGSTTVQNLFLIGYTPLESKKLTYRGYNALS